jgi:hypothetical protein
MLAKPMGIVPIAIFILSGKCLLVFATKTMSIGLTDPPPPQPVWPIYIDRCGEVLVLHIRIRVCSCLTTIFIINTLFGNSVG